MSAAYPLTPWKVVGSVSEYVKGGEQHTPPGAVCSQIHTLTFGTTAWLTGVLTLTLPREMAEDPMLTADKSSPHAFCDVSGMSSRLTY